MSTTIDNFIKDIVANPKDDSLRLIYADWLEDHNQPEKAEFIRLQLRIAKIEVNCLCGRCVGLRGGGQQTNGPCGVDQERDELPDARFKQAFLRRRERDLLETMIDTSTSTQKSRTQARYLWFQEMLGPELKDKVCVWSCEFHRGLVSKITLPFREFFGRPCGGHMGGGCYGKICTICSGSKYTNRYGPQLIRNMPLETITFLDRKPAVNIDHDIPYDGFWWGYLAPELEGPRDRPWRLPRPLFDLMYNMFPVAVSNSGGVAGDKRDLRFNSSKNALYALSESSISWAKFANELEEKEIELLSYSNPCSVCGIFEDRKLDKQWNGQRCNSCSKCEKRLALLDRIRELSILVNGK